MNSRKLRYFKFHPEQKKTFLFPILTIVRTPTMGRYSGCGMTLSDAIKPSKPLITRGKKKMSWQISSPIIPEIWRASNRVTTDQNGWNFAQRPLQRSVRGVTIEFPKKISSDFVLISSPMTCRKNGKFVCFREESDKNILSVIFDPYQCFLANFRSKRPSGQSWDRHPFPCSILSVHANFQDFKRMCSTSRESPHIRIVGKLPRTIFFPRFR